MSTGWLGEKGGCKQNELILSRQIRKVLSMIGNILLHLPPAYISGEKCVHTDAKKHFAMPSLLETGVQFVKKRPW